MNEPMKPILFNTEMVRAILDGHKTVTRRAIKPQPTEHLTCGPNWKELLTSAATPYHPGDVLWVRETWYYESHMYDPSEGDALQRYVYRATSPDYPVNVGVGQHGWRPSSHMPREAARLFLRVKNVWVEPLQEIDKRWDNYDKDGVRNPALENISIAMQEKFIAAWDSTIKPTALPSYGWAANPWVWVIEFERCEKPAEEE